jgi:hypothetical protein
VSSLVGGVAVRRERDGDAAHWPHASPPNAGHERGHTYLAGARPAPWRDTASPWRGGSEWPTRPLQFPCGRCANPGGDPTLTEGARQHGRKAPVDASQRAIYLSEQPGRRGATTASVHVAASASAGTPPCAGGSSERGGGSARSRGGSPAGDKGTGGASARGSTRYRPNFVCLRPTAPKLHRSPDLSRHG